jgi:ribonuclease D
MLEYAASDTIHLRKLADLLRARLDEAGRLAWALEECRFLEEVRWEGERSDEIEDPVSRVRGARDLTPREVAFLREALAWRDNIARARDKAPFRIAGDQALLEVVVRRPGTPSQLAEVKGFSRDLANQEGQDLLKHMARVALLPDGEIVPYPRRARTGPGRLSPDAEERAMRLKEVRNHRAEELMIDRGTLLSNAVLFEIARRDPNSRDDLDAVPGLRRWQANALGETILATLNKRRVAAR